MKHRDLLPEIKLTIERVAPGSQIILFGSLARGEEKEDSDIDILILVNKDDMDWREKDKIKESLIDLEIRTGIRTDCQNPKGMG